MVARRVPRRFLGVAFDRRDAGFALVLAVAVVVTWLGTYHKTPAQIAEPVVSGYAYDAMYQLGAIKAAGERGLGALWGAVDPYLGAPTGARWGDFPSSEDVIYLGIGVLSRVAGPILGLNLAFIGTAILAAWCMYFVGRRLRLSRYAAALAGGLFAMAPYIYWRNVHHFNLTVYWPLPLVLLVWVWASSRRGLTTGTKRFTQAALVMALVAVHSNYYLNYAMQVMLAIVVLHLVRRRWRAAWGGFAVMLVAMGVFLLVNADTLVGFIRFGPNPGAVARSIDDMVRFGLRPMELLIPSNLHRIPGLDRLGALYRPHGTGEFPSPFLGFVGVAGFLVLVVQGLGALFFREVRGMPSRFFGFSLWLIWVAVPGGLMHLAQLLAGFTAFRSNNRVSILILGMAVLFAGKGLDRLLRGRPQVVVASVFGVLLVFGLWEQSPDLHKLGDIATERLQMLARIDHDQKLAARLDAELPDDAAVMEWPPMAFPEGGGAPGVPDYDYFRPYLYTRKLRFSYGAMKGRPEGEYASRLWTAPPAAALSQLDADGFRAVMFNLHSVGSERGRAWAEAAKAAKPTRSFIAEGGEWFVVLW